GPLRIHQADGREDEGGLASLADLQGDRRRPPLPEPLPLPPAPHQERPGMEILEAHEPVLRPRPHNGRFRVHPDAGAELHHHRYRAVAAGRRVLGPRPSLRQGGVEVGKIRALDQGPVEELARRREGPDRPCLRHLASLRGLHPPRPLV
ncbi:hypothetical protein AVDCRST_MAG82-1849, partial [uncultured Rubrobacteraceae bacterium]